MSAPTIESIDNLGFVADEDIQIASSIKGFGVPLGGTAATRNANLFGKKRIITLTGVQSGEGYVGATVDIRINAFIADVEAWINATLGAQGTREYTDSFGNTYNVLCLSFQRIRRIDGEGRLLYVFTFIQGGTIS